MQDSPSFPRSLAEMWQPVTIETVTPRPALDVPRVLGDVVFGTDRLIYVPRLRIKEMVVYVAMETSEPPVLHPGMVPVARTPRALYVGVTSDLDGRRSRHESEVQKGDDARAAGSNIPFGAFELLRADWLAVPVEAKHARKLERALTVILRPMLQRIRPGRLDARHRQALVAGGWTEEAADHLVRLANDKGWQGIG